MHPASASPDFADDSVQASGQAASQALGQSSRAVRTWVDFEAHPGVGFSAASMMQHLLQACGALKEFEGSQQHCQVEGPMVGSVVASVVDTRSGALHATNREAWIETDRLDDRHDGWTTDRTGPDGRWVVVDSMAGLLFSDVGQRSGRNVQTLPPEQVTGIATPELDVVSWAKVDRTTWVLHDGDGAVLVEVQADSSRTMGTQESSHRLLVIGPHGTGPHGVARPSQDAEQLIPLLEVVRVLTLWLGEPQVIIGEPPESAQTLELEPEPVREREDLLRAALRAERDAVALADQRWAVRNLRRWARRTAGQPWPIQPVALSADLDEIRMQIVALMQLNDPVQMLQELLHAWRSDQRSDQRSGRSGSRASSSSGTRHLTGKRAARLRVGLVAVMMTTGTNLEVKRAAQRLDRRMRCRRREAMLSLIEDIASAESSPTSARWLSPETWMALGVERQRLQARLDSKYARLHIEVRQLIDLIQRS
jgi:hypothetical protein